MTRKPLIVDWLYGPKFAQLFFKYSAQKEEINWYYLAHSPSTWAVVNGLISMYHEVRPPLDFKKIIISNFITIIKNRDHVLLPDGYDVSTNVVSLRLQLKNEKFHNRRKMKLQI